MRIVSLLPSATDIVAFLGLEDQLVGISHECDHPAVTDRPRLTSSILSEGLSPKQIDEAVSRAGLEETPLYAIDEERLLALEPDLILTQGVCQVCAVSEDTLTPVSALCEAQVVSLSAVDVAGIFADLEAVAEAAGVEASERIEALRERWAQVRPAGGRPRVAMLEWSDPPWTAGHWVPEQVEKAGGEDVLGTAGAESERIDWDQVREADPDVIIVACCGFDLERNATEVAKVPEDLRAVREERVVPVDANAFFSRPGPGVVEGAERLAALLGALG